MHAHTQAPPAVTVSWFAREWVAPGGERVPSMIKATPLSENVAPPPLAYKAEAASRLRKPDFRGLGDLSLERALEALNGEQVQLNKERARLYEAVGMFREGCRRVLGRCVCALPRCLPCCVFRAAC